MLKGRRQYLLATVRPNLVLVFRFLHTSLFRRLKDSQVEAEQRYKVHTYLLFQCLVDVLQVVWSKLLKGGDLNRLNVLHDEPVICVRIQ